MMSAPSNSTIAKKHIFISTGEASGDLLAAELVNSLRQMDPDLLISGMGSKELSAKGARIIIDSSNIAVVGFWEIVTHFKYLWRARKQIISFFKKEKPDLVVLVDYPGFNLRVAHWAARFKIPVFYYVSPQIWAWHYSRIKKIKKTVQHMAVLFPFEEEIYKKENIPVTFVGHPLAERNIPRFSKDEIFNNWHLNPQNPVIGLFPGSRLNEIKRLLPIILETIPLIRKQLPRAQFVLPLAKNLNLETIKTYFGSELSIRTLDSQNGNSTATSDSILIIQDYTYDLLSICSAAIAASGTVTLEIALQQVPLVIIYKVSLLSAIIIKSLIRVKNIGLCNIIANEVIAKELLQWQAKPELIAEEAIQLIQNSSYRNNILKKLQQITEKLSSQQASQKTAQAVLSLLDR